jgi:hypothetical protein
MASDWPLLTGGRYSEVVVRTGLTVYMILILVSMTLKKIHRIEMAFASH